MEDGKIWSQNSAKNVCKTKWSKILSSKLVTKWGYLSGLLLWHLRLPYVVNKIYKYICTNIISNQLVTTFCSHDLHQLYMKYTTETFLTSITLLWLPRKLKAKTDFEVRAKKQKWMIGTVINCHNNCLSISALLVG